MKILTIHVDYIKFKPLKKALKNAEITEEEKKEKEVKEALVVLTAVEKTDRDENQYIKEIKDISNQVKTKTIVLYPYAHLSSNLASPETAVEIMKNAGKKLSKEGYNVIRAPFGFYKEFELKCKGHPLSELSREIKQEGKVEEKEGYNPKQLLNEISKSVLDTSKLKENDHRILGKKMDLFSFNETAPGAVFWHNNGLIIYNELIKFWREEHKKAGYKEISTPQILDKKLWQISGHWEKYRENIFLTEYEKRTFAVKPMNCPGGLLVYKSAPKSYKDLPLRVAELGIVHRQELSGVLGGLFRLVRFTQDDAHIFCMDEKQVEKEIINLMKLVDKFYKKFSLPYHLELSTRPEKRIGSDKIWDISESILNKVIKKSNKKFKLNKGDGAFYGPKIYFHIKDSLGRTWQLATIQLDFAMPERFDLEYTDKNNKKQKPIMIHRTIYGSLERFIGILLEHLNGNLPAWLSPIQVRVISFTDRNRKTCEKFIRQVGEKIPYLRLDADFRDMTVNSKVRDAEISGVKYIIVIGDKEEKSKTLAVRDKGRVSNQKVERFINDIRKEIIERR